MPPFCRDNPPKSIFIAVIAVFICTLPFSAAFSAGGSVGMGGITCHTINNTKIVNLINGYRARNGLGLLKQNTRLGISTSLKTRDMIRKSYFAHTNPEGRPFSDNIKKARYDYRSVAEVLAKGCKTESQVLSLWAKSPPHNDALLDPAFSDINCSTSISHGLTYVACHLGSPRTLAMSSSRR